MPYICCESETNVVKKKGKLAEAIDKSGLKRGHIAECLDISRVQLWRLENGEAEPSLSQANKLETLLRARIYPRSDTSPNTSSAAAA